MDSIKYLTADERAELSSLRLSAIARDAYSHSLTSTAFAAMGQMDESRKYLVEMESLNRAFLAVQAEAQRWEDSLNADDS